MRQDIPVRLSHTANIFFFVSNDVKLKATGNCHVLILNNTKGAETEVKHLGVAIDGGEQVLHVGRPPRQLASAGGAAAHLIHRICLSKWVE